jgi:hypothetical protein
MEMLALFIFMQIPPIDQQGIEILNDLKIELEQYRCQHIFSFSYK